jgi:hypothetical protein
MQNFIVGFLVVLALAYACWYWLPQSLRRHLGRVNQGLAQSPQCGACQATCEGCGKTAAEAQALPGPAAPGPTAKTPIWMRPH